METPAPSPVFTTMDSATRKHHKFGPSRLEYIDNCAAFENRADDGNEASLEGQMLHDFMSMMLDRVYLPGTGAEEGKNYPNTMTQLEDWVFPNHELSDDQQIALRFCCKRCDELIARGPTKILTEISIEVTNPDGTQLNHGYLDVLFIFANLKIGILLDFKFGWIPVPPADVNLQGLNYTLGSFQQFAELQKILMEFVQPRLGRKTQTVYDRANCPEYHKRIKELIELAIYVQENPADAPTYMHPGPYCEYCALAPSCTMLHNHRQEAAARYGMLPELPPQFPGMELAKPEDWALALYWADVIEKGLEGFKAKARDMAEANGGELRCSLPTGEEIVYSMEERNCDRSLSGPTEIAEAMQEYATIEQILACADLPVGKTLKVLVDSFVEVRKAEGTKITKKEATKQIEDTLTAMGLLSTPDKKIRYLKLQKGATAPTTAGAPQLPPPQQ